MKRALPSRDLSELAEQHAAKFQHIALRYMKNAADAEDAVQDAFLMAYRKLHLFKGTAQLKTWFTRVLINTCLMKLRRKHPVVSLEEMIETDDYGLNVPAPTVDLARAADLARLRELVKQLPPGQRQITELRLQDLFVRDIAYICKITVGSVKSQEFKGRQKLRKWMTEGTA